MATRVKRRDKAVEFIADANLHWYLGISRQAVSQWRKVPVNRVLEVEKVTGIPRHKLRPDIYPAEEKRRRVRTRSKRTKQRKS